MENGENPVIYRMVVRYCTNDSAHTIVSCWSATITTQDYVDHASFVLLITWIPLIIWVRF